VTNRTEQGNTAAGPTKTVAVADVRHTTPSPFAGIACMLGHTYRVVLEKNQPIALECAHCAATWKTERVKADPAS